jgi:hypothetical protein
MTHTLFHAQSSVRRFGGKVEDYRPLHDWLDATKETFCDFRHRALRHHPKGVFEAERVFGATILNSDGRLWRHRAIGLGLAGAHSAGSMDEPRIFIAGSEE